MDTIRADLRFALRQLLRAPGFTIVAVLTLALGIGANSALYTVADSITRRARPGIQEPASLLWIGATSRERARPTGVSYQVAERLRQDLPLLERVATIRDLPLSLASRGEPVKVKGQAVSGEYFSMLRIPFALGRGFTTDEDATEGAHPVVVLSYHAWGMFFGNDSSLIGQHVIVNGLPMTVLGITAEGFNGAEHDDIPRAVWVPSSMLAVLLPEWRWMVTDASNSNIDVLARLRSTDDRATVDAGARRLASIIAAGDTTRPAGWTLSTYDASAGIPAGGAQAIVPLAALSFTVTGLVLLICCANVSNLMLARAHTRQREIATRLSIGASRRRVVRQLLTEAVLLATVASGLGLLIGTWGTELLIAFALPLPLDISLDWRVFAVSAALALFTGVLFGLAPALHATRDSLATVLRGTSGGSRRHGRLQGSLVIAQVAFSMLLLTMSGLFVRSLDKARRVEVGFDASRRVLALSYDLGLQRYDSARAASFTDEALARVRALPGVQSASMTNLLPLTEWISTIITIDRSLAGEAAAETRSSLSAVHTDYFRTIGTQLLSGRDFVESDGAGAQLVAIVSETFANRHLAGLEPLGSRISLDGDRGPWRTVIGVARDAVVQSLGAPPMGAVYLPVTQSPATAVTLLVRSAGTDAGALGPTLRSIIHGMDPALPVHRELTLDRVREQATKEQRAGAAVLAIFGALALILASIGLYGVLHFTVRQRTREIGIRVALGATTGDLTRQIIRRGLRLTIVGGAIGLVLALGATQLTRSMLFGIAPTDAITFILVSALFGAVALVACWVPARRAARIDPVVAMRVE